MTIFRTIGLVCVAGGLLLLKYRKKGKKSEQIHPAIVIAALASCMLNSVSGLMDKILMQHVTSTQLQFWYMLFLVLMYLVYVMISRSGTNFVSSVKNPWIWAMAILFVIADKCLFVANGIEDSKVTVMTLIKQSGCIITILSGKFIFHEKNITHKLICASIIIIGIVIGTIN